MNAFITRPIVEHAVSLFTNATPRDFPKAFRKAACAPFIMFGARQSRRTYQQPCQDVTHFPDVVCALGRRAFESYWH